MTCSSSKSRLGHLGVLASLLGAVACSEPGDAEPLAQPEYSAIDDMEGATGRIGWLPQHPAPDALPGRWVSYADVQCADLSPIPEWAPDGDGGWAYSELPTARETLSGVTSRHAARLFTAAPILNTWGAGMGFQFSEPPPGNDTTLVTRPCTGGALPDLDYPAVPVDLSDYSGIVFWGMANADAGASTILIQFQDSHTDPRGGICNPVPESADTCYNGFGVLLTLGNTFERYEIDFAELEQNPLWGYRPPSSAFDVEHVYGLAFQIDTPGGICTPPTVCLDVPKLSFDIWIDDLYFVKR